MVIRSIAPLALFFPSQCKSSLFLSAVEQIQIDEILVWNPRISRKCFKVVDHIGFESNGDRLLQTLHIWIPLCRKRGQGTIFGFGCTTPFGQNSVKGATPPWIDPCERIEQHELTLVRLSQIRKSFPDPVTGNGVREEWRLLNARLLRLTRWVFPDSSDFGGVFRGIHGAAG